MLKFFSRLEKTRNFVLFLFVLVMVASLVLFFAPTRDTAQSNLAFSKDVAAKVGSESVTVGDLARQQESTSRMFGGRSMPAKFFIDGMIRDRIARIEANRLGLGVSDAEVAAEIRDQFKSQDGKPFDQARYEQNVTEQFGSVQAFEQNARDSIANQKLQAFITSGVSVSEEEVLNDFKRKNSKFDLSFVPVNTAQVAESIKPTDEGLKAYFEQNKANYRINLPQKKIRYIFLNTAKIGEKLEVPEADLKADYDKLTPERKQAGVNGQQIVIRIPKPDQESQTLAKAEEIATQARKDGGKTTEEAFAELAKGRSEDPASAATGGKLRGLVRPNPNNPTDPYQRLLAMQEGEVSEPVKFGTSFYILRRGASVPKSYEDAKKELEISARNRKAYEAASTLAQKVSDRLKEVKDVQKVAEEFAGQANSNAKEMVRETDYVKKDDDVPNIGVSPQFEEGIAMLENQNDVGSKIPIKEGFAIPLLVDKKEPRDAELAEVKERVTEAYKLDQAGKRVEQLAKDIAAGATSASALSAAAQSKGLKAEESKNHILGSPLGQGPSAATSEALEEAVYALKAGEVTKTPIKAGDNWYIVGVTNRSEANMDEFAKQRDQLVQSMLGAKRGQVFQDYLADVRRRMEAAGQVVVYNDAIAKLEPTPEVETPEGKTN